MKVGKKRLCTDRPRTIQEMKEITYPTMLRYTIEQLARFVDFCEKHGYSVKITQWDIKQIPNVEIKSREYSVDILTHYNHTHVYVIWQQRMMRLDYAISLGFEPIYRPIASECEKVAITMQNMKTVYTHDCVLMWLRCAMRLGLIQDMRMMIGRMLAHEYRKMLSQIIN